MTVRLHLALSTHDLDASIQDYSQRLGTGPCATVAGAYALWRTDTINLSVRVDLDTPPGTLRHLGHEDPTAAGFSVDTDVNGLVWERFTAAQQAEEIAQAWPGSGYSPTADPP